MKKYDLDKMNKKLKKVLDSKDKKVFCESCKREMVFQEWVARQAKCAMCTLKEELG